ncbi:MAG: sugar transferase [Crocinitomicaceae bacterium]|nr:sugar transferase [Crocinitomicaceae bacterium]
MKRLFDIAIAILVLLIFLPFGIILSVMISLESRGGVFYIQERIGKNGVPFGLYKFRTMRKNADKQGKLTVGSRDARITKVGYFLRKVKLDEFPQFLNVLIGEMSVVGPRPEVEEYVKLYTNEQREVLSVRPGITDYASLEYFHENDLLGKSKNPHETYINEVMPAKIKLNKKYLERPTVAHDLKIMWRTFVKIIS